jgi:orotidine-5'-phosphate decarboxylase
VGGLKVGLEFFSANGPQGVRALAEAGKPIFADLKFHDIPNTVGRAVRAATSMGVSLLNVHASGGRTMLKAAAEAAAAAEAGAKRPQIVAVTVLTSFDQHDLEEISVTGTVRSQVLHLAGLAAEAGLDGVVCSAWEVETLRSEFGPDFLIVVPGIRPAGPAGDDQKRTMTAEDAVAAGADIVVIGRPITKATDPGAAARNIAAALGR